jgi:DNA-nicking Smr family endonuclease
LFAVSKKDQDHEGRLPFSGLEGLVRKAGLKLRVEPEPMKEAPPEAPASPAVAADSDEDAFRLAMDGVTRRTWRHSPVPSPPPPFPEPADPDLEDLRLMQAAVDGDPALTVQDHPEYIEGWVGLGGRRYLPNLRDGLYSIQGQIDLHGMSRDEARVAVENFIIGMSRQRSCCVKVIHGRGINSPNDRAVLKENLSRWLATRRMSRHVVAYASAPFKDGGVGAIYVLLRRCV